MLILVLRLLGYVDTCSQDAWQWRQWDLWLIGWLAAGFCHCLAACAMTGFQDCLARRGVSGLKRFG
jgi:hypothetical protein